MTISWKAGAFAATVERLELEPLARAEEATVPMRATRSGAPVFAGNGAIDYVCASCGHVLCKRMRSGQLAGLVFSCSGCGGLNRVPPAPPAMS